MIETKRNINNEKNGIRDAALQETCEPSDPSDSDISECVSSLDLGTRNRLFSKQQVKLIKLRPSIISRHFPPICMASSTPMHPIPKMSFTNSSVLSSINTNGKCVDDSQLPIPSTSRLSSGLEEIEPSLSGRKGEKSNGDVLERLQEQNDGCHSLTTRSGYGHRDTTSGTSKLSAPFNKKKVIQKRSRSGRKSTLKRNSIHVKAKIYKYLKSIVEDFFENSSDTEDSSERPVKKNRSKSNNHKTPVSVIPNEESISTFIENQTSESSSNSFIYNVPIDIPPLTNCVNGVINSTEKQDPQKQNGQLPAIHATRKIERSRLEQQVQKFLKRSAVVPHCVINDNSAKNASQLSRKCFNTKTQKLLVGDKEKATQEIDEPINPHGQINCKIPKSVNSENKTKQTMENTKDVSKLQSYFCGSNDNIEKSDGEEKSTKNHHSDYADLIKEIELRSRKSRSEIPKWRTIANASKPANNTVGERLLESLETVSPLRGRRGSQIRKSFICDVSKSITNTVDDVCVEDDQINSKITPQKLVGDKHFSKRQTLENIINTVTCKSKNQKSVVNAEVNKQSKDFAKHNLVSGSEDKKLSQSIQNQKSCKIDVCEDDNDNRNILKLSKTQMSVVCDKDVEKTLQEIHGQSDDEIKSTNSEKCTNNKNKRKEIRESTKEISPLNKRPRSSRNIGKSTKNNLALQNTIDVSKENVDIIESPKSRSSPRDIVVILEDILLKNNNQEKVDSFHKNVICEVPKEKQIRKSRSKTRKSHTSDNRNQNESRKLSDENPDNVTSLQDRMGLCKNSFIDGCTTSTEQSSLKENLEHAPPKKRGKKKKRDTIKEVQSTTVLTDQGNQMELCKNSFIDGCTTSIEQSSLKENFEHAPLKKRGRKKKHDINKDLQSTIKENTKEGNKTVTRSQTNEIDLIQNQSKTDESDEDTRNISKLPKLNKTANTDISKCIKEDVEKKRQQPNQPPKKKRKEEETHT